jgi:hypothetical protein
VDFNVGGVSIKFSSPGETTITLARRKNGNDNAGAYGVCIWPCSGNWSGVVNREDICYDPVFPTPLGLHLR